MSIFDYMDEPVVVIGIIALIGAVIYLIYHIYDDVSSSNAAEKYKKEYEYRWYDQKPEFDRQYNEYCKKARLETADYIETILHQNNRILQSIFHTNTKNYT